ncbi:hypothetical protein [Pectobacterium sp. CHL-2024]
MVNSGSLPFMKLVSQVTDPYERQARLYPALISISPLLVMIIVLYQEQLSKFHTLLFSLVSCGGLFLMSDIARRRGKMKEKSLWASWGGVPSVQVLRYSDDTFDDVSTSRYHAILSKKIGVKFPSQQDEHKNPQDADKVYASAGNYLRTATRDTQKFHLIFKDNISYGFRRNGYGLKTIGVTLCFICIIWVVIRHGIDSVVARLHLASGFESLLLPEEWVTSGISLLMLFIWLLVFTQSALREAGFSYAEKLIHACEMLPETTNPKPRAKKKKSTSEHEII